MTQLQRESRHFAINLVDDQLELVMIPKSLSVIQASSQSAKVPHKVTRLGTRSQMVVRKLHEGHSKNEHDNSQQQHSPK